MRNRMALVFLPALVMGVACAKTPPYTIPAPVAPTADIQYYDLEVPRDLEVKAVDFDATTYADVGGPAGGPTTSTVSFAHARALDHSPRHPSGGRCRGVQRASLVARSRAAARERLRRLRDHFVGAARATPGCALSRARLRRA
jgi:hypothetical protein